MLTEVACVRVALIAPSSDKLPGVSPLEHIDPCGTDLHIVKKQKTKHVRP
jgi:hypothetical protein